MDSIHEKKQRLESYLKEKGRIAVAFSSGVDSTFLLKVAHEILGDKVIAITARSRSFPSRELNEAIAFCRKEGIEQVIVDSNELEIEGFRRNPKDRCYICKKALFTKFIEVAKARGIPFVAEGSNMDDNGDYRPGLKAVAELKILSPLREAELYKEEIRILSKELNLPTWDKPSYACLASRFVYGEIISEEKLSMVERAEQKLMDLGFRQVRVRIHGNIARIEVAPAELEKIVNLREEISGYLHGLGFAFVSLDLDGYKMGSMNKTL